MCLSILASHLGGLFHHKPALVAPLFLWVGYPMCAQHTLFPPFQLCAYMCTHSGQPGPHPGSMPTCAPLCTPCTPFFLGFSYTHFTSCALAHSHLYPMARG